MLRRFRDRFGAAGLAVAIAAFTLAVGGTALAASGALTGKQKKEVEKIAKRYAGKPGPAGAAGTNGTKGDPGAPGTVGSDGTSAEAIAFSGEAHGCKEGGLEVKSAKPTTFICNGEKGAPGETGFVDQLPSKESLSGVWSTSGGIGEEASSDYSMVPISFAFPLASAPTVVLIEKDGITALRITPAADVDFPTTGELATDCPGEAAEPEASAGFLCVYTEKEEGAFINLLDPAVLLVGAKPFGYVIPMRVTAEKSYATGSWAVTAP